MMQLNWGLIMGLNPAWVNPKLPQIRVSIDEIFAHSSHICHICFALNVGRMRYQIYHPLNEAGHQLSDAVLGLKRFVAQSSTRLANYPIIDNTYIYRGTTVLH
jgi:hypothetical protein